MAAVTESVASWYRETQRRVLALTDDLSEEEFGARPAGAAHSIAWNVWHLARWADDVQAAVPAATGGLGGRLAPRQQLWEAEGLAAKWGLESGALGDRQTGMLMDEEAAARLPLPNKDVVLAYARRAFAAAEEAVAAIDDATFVGARHDGGAGTVGNNIVMSHLVHNNRHLGEIECLRGQLGLRGTATR